MAVKVVMDALNAGLKELLDSGNFSDLTIVCGSGRIAVHKSVMSARSKFFYKALTTNMKEKRENVIELHDDLQLVRCLIKFCYTGGYECEEVEDKWAAIGHHAKVNALAEKYDVAGLSDRATEKWRLNAISIVQGISKRQGPWKEDIKEWRKVVESIYTTTAKRDNLLRRAVADLTRDYDLPVLEDDCDEWDSLICKLPEFGADYILRYEVQEW